MTRRKRSKSRTYYDPDPRRRTKHRSRRGKPRRGIEPAGLKRWRLSRRRRADPGYARSVRQGPRGGWYFAGPKKRRYDPAPRRFGRARSYARATGSKLEHGINRYGTILGGLIALVAGVWYGMNEYAAAYGKNAAGSYFNTIIGGEIKNDSGQVIAHRTPEISHVAGIQDDLFKGNSLDYLAYKFAGIDMAQNNKYVGSAWVIPFWTSLVAYLAGPIAKMFTSKGQRILRPISKIGKGALIVSTVGALALPGSPQPAQGSPIQGPQNIPYARNEISAARLV